MVDIKVSDFISHHIFISFPWQGVLLRSSRSSDHITCILFNYLHFLIRHFLFSPFLRLFLVKRSELILCHPLWLLNLCLIEYNMHPIHLISRRLLELRRSKSNVIGIHLNSFLFLLHQLVNLINFLHNL